MQRLPSATNRMGTSRAMALMSPEPASLLAASTWLAAMDEIIDAAPAKGTTSTSRPTSRKYPRSTPMYTPAEPMEGVAAKLRCSGGVSAAGAEGLAPVAPPPGDGLAAPAVEPVGFVLLAGPLAAGPQPARPSAVARSTRR